MKHWLMLLLLNAVAWAQGGHALNASTFPGADCGAKVNAAEASLGANGGEIDVDNSCGTSVCTKVMTPGSVR